MSKMRIHICKFKYSQQGVKMLFQNFNIKIRKKHVKLQKIYIAGATVLQIQANTLWRPVSGILNC